MFIIKKNLQKHVIKKLEELGLINENKNNVENENINEDEIDQNQENNENRNQESNENALKPI